MKPPIQATATLYHSTDPDDGYVIIAAADPAMLRTRLRKLGMAHDQIDGEKFYLVTIAPREPDTSPA
jgi:hypothetical protein